MGLSLLDYLWKRLANVINLTDLCGLRAILSYLYCQAGKIFTMNLEISMNGSRFFSRPGSIRMTQAPDKLSY